MAGISVHISSPGQNTVVGRSATVSGSVLGLSLDRRPKPIRDDSLDLVTIQFGVGGPTVNAAHARRSFDWSWQGLIPNNIRPGQAFRIIVHAEGDKWIVIVRRTTTWTAMPASTSFSSTWCLC